MPDNRKTLPDHYRCEQCGRRFVIDFSPKKMCAMHAEDGPTCCHVGEMHLDSGGRQIEYVKSPECIVIYTNEWAE